MSPLTASAHTFSGTAESIRDARAFTRAELERCGLPDQVVYNAQLAVSELATNAIRHSRSGGPDGTYALAVANEDRGARVAVVDQGGPSEPRIAELDDVDAEGGRGLGMLARLAHVGWDGDHESHRVWALIPTGDQR